MSDLSADRRKADAINDAMVAAMNRRRRQHQERRRVAQPAFVERRKICSYCFQPGDHGSPRACLNALQR
jgi:hypothetical protein